MRRSWTEMQRGVRHITKDRTRRKPKWVGVGAQWGGGSLENFPNLIAGLGFKS